MIRMRNMDNLFNLKVVEVGAQELHQLIDAVRVRRRIWTKSFCHKVCYFELLLAKSDLP